MESLEEATDKSDYNFDEIKEDNDKERREQFLFDSHQFECDFYNTLAPILDAPVPKVYKTTAYKSGKKEGVLHMEDLTLRGRTISYFENINLTQVKSLIRILAHMHKNTLCADPKLWEGKFLKNQEMMAGATKAFEIMMAPFLKRSKSDSKV